MSSSSPLRRALRVAVGPADSWRLPRMVQAVERGGARVVEAAEAEAVVWVEPRPGPLGEVLDACPGVRWVQLPFAGIEPFVGTVRERPHLEWTCGKGVYARPVAEHALALALAGLRGLVSYARQRTWSGPRGRNLFGARVTVLGGGGITEELLPLLEPFGCHVDVLRRRADRAVPGAGDRVRVRPMADLHALLPETDVLFLALALTDETAGIVGAPELALLPRHAWLVNVARGGHVDTDALVDALRNDRIGGAALDVTDPEEPLPDGHPLWELDNCIVTPHIGNTPEMGIVLLDERVCENVRRRAAGEELLGPVDPALGY